MTKELIAQWVIDNRYGKSENDKVSDSEMYHKLVDEIESLIQNHGVIETLLEKYIDHVSQCEGISFVNKCNKTYASDVVFTDDEIETLKRLD